MTTGPQDQTSPTGTPNTSLLDSRIEKALDDRGMGDGGSGGGSGSNNDRLTRLEAVFEGFREIVEGLRHSQNWTLGAIAILAAVMIGLGAYMLNRLDTISDKVDAVPQQVNTNMQELTRTLATAITASKQQAPQVILVPAQQAIQKPTAPK